MVIWQVWVDGGGGGDGGGVGIDGGGDDENGDECVCDSYSGINIKI